MKNEYPYDDANIDPRVARIKDVRRLDHLWRLSQAMLNSGHLTRQEAADARSAIAARTVELIVNDPEAYRAALKNGALNQWLEMADGPDIAGESADGKAARHEAAYRKVRAGSVDIELANHSTPARLRAAYDIAAHDTPEFVEAARELAGIAQTAPGNLDGELRALTDSERENVATLLWHARNNRQAFETPEVRAAAEKIATREMQSETAPKTTEHAGDWSESDMSKFFKEREVSEAKDTIAQSGYSANKAPSGHSLVREPTKDDSNG